MEIKFTLRVVEDIDEIYEHLVKTDECVAKSVLLHIESSVESLREFPKIGKKGIVAKTREIIVPKLPYIIVYEIVDNVIFILTVFHTSRNPNIKFFM